MGILDEAIREHLELKRQHGAGDSELKDLEDEAFGPPARPGEEDSQPDPFAEAPTEFMSAPPAAPGEESEAAESKPESAEAEERPAGRRESVAEVQEAPESPVEDEPQAPAEEEHPAMEHEAVTEPPAEEPLPEPSTEERERLAIASQPTEMFDVAGEIAASEPAPSEEELLEEEMNEPRLAPVEPVIEAVEAERVAEEEEDEDDDFFDERRLSEELDQALEAPVEEPPADSEEFEAVVEVAEEEDDEDEEYEDEDEGELEEEEDEDEPPAARRGNDEDVLEDTPDFLEDSEDDQLWFEQKPPKDFDFDD